MAGEGGAGGAGSLAALGEQGDRGGAGVERAGEPRVGSARREDGLGGEDGVGLVDVGVITDLEAAVVLVEERFGAVCSVHFSATVEAPVREELRGLVSA